MQGGNCKIHNKSINIICLDPICEKMPRLFCQSCWMCHNSAHLHKPLQQVTKFINKYANDISVQHQQFKKMYQAVNQQYDRHLNILTKEKDMFNEQIKKIQLYFMELDIVADQKQIFQQFQSSPSHLDFYAGLYRKSHDKIQQKSIKIKSKLHNFQKEIQKFIKLLEQTVISIQKVNEEASKYISNKLYHGQQNGNELEIYQAQQMQQSNQSQHIDIKYQQNSPSLQFDLPILQNQTKNEKKPTKNYKSLNHDVQEQQSQNELSKDKNLQIQQQNKSLFKIPSKQIFELNKSQSNSFVSFSEKHSNSIGEYNKYEIEGVLQLWEKSQKQIYEELANYEEKQSLLSIKKLVIRATNRQQAIKEQTLSIIQKMTNLQWLEILWMRKISYIKVINTIKHLKNLKFINLGKFQMKRQFFKQLCINAKNLKICQNLYDYRHNFEYELLFTQLFPTPQIEEPNLSQIKYLMQCPQLESLWISQPDNNQYQNLPKRLKQIKLGCYNKKSKLGTISQQLLNAFKEREMQLQKLKSYVSLFISKTQLEILKKTKDLRTLVIIKAGNKNQVYNQIQNLNTLRQLLLLGMKIKRSWTFKNLKKLTHLSVDCDIQDKNQFLISLKPLHRNLKLLSLRLLKHTCKDTEIGIKLTEIVSQFSQLTFLDINSCGINGTALVKLSKLLKLKTLICGQNPLNGEDIADFAQKNNNILIQKLVLIGLDGTNNDGLVKSQDLKRIAAGWKTITHLNIYKTSVESFECLQDFEKLKLVRISEKKIGQQTLKLLASRNVTIIQK